MKVRYANFFITICTIGITICSPGCSSSDDDSNNKSRREAGLPVIVDDSGVVHVIDSGNTNTGSDAGGSSSQVIQCIGGSGGTAANPGTVSTVAGDGTSGFQDGAAASAKFKNPYAVAVDSAGKIYVSDASNHRIRVIANGQVTTLAGTGEDAFLDGPAASAKFCWPGGIAVNNAGTTVYVADRDNYRIRIITGGQVTTLAGSGKKGYFDNYGTGAQFSTIEGLALDEANSKLYAVDSGNNKIRMIDLNTKQVTTVAGTITGRSDGPTSSAQFDTPMGLALDSQGKLYVGDKANHRIRVIDLAANTVKTLAGSGSSGFEDAAACGAKFQNPSGVAVDTTGKVYILDQTNKRIRVVSNGTVSTFAGGESGFADGPGQSAQFKLTSPALIAVDSTGNVYVPDIGNNKIRLITP